MLADWTCDINDCIYPLDSTGLNRNFTRYKGKIPAAWIVAQKTMSSLAPKLSLRITDQNHIATRDVSLSHALKVCDHIAPMDLIDNPNGVTAKSLRTGNVRTIKDIGGWVINEKGTITFKAKAQSFVGWSEAKKNNWIKITQRLSQVKPQAFYGAYDWDLLKSRSRRQREATTLIHLITEAYNFEPSPASNGEQLWGSDGSMVPPDSGLDDDKSIMAAITGPSSMVVRIKGRSASILQGELMGLIMGHVIADASHATPTLWTDHLNAVRMIEDNNSLVDQMNKLRNMNGRSYYRWLFDLQKTKKIQVSYTKGHSAESTTCAILNAHVDHFASKAQSIAEKSSYAPEPTFFMDEFTFYRDTDRWIESNIRNYLDHFLAKASLMELQHRHSSRMALSLYDNHNPPEYSYLKAQSAYTAVIQLYGRSGQLASMELLYKRGKSLTDKCRFECGITEDYHHIFVKCPKFSNWRGESSNNVLELTKRRLDEAKIEEEYQSPILTKAKCIFADLSDVWPLHESVYYLGLLPTLEPALLSMTNLSALSCKRLLYEISADWHLASIRLASRIFGEIQRFMAQKVNIRTYKQGRSHSPQRLMASVPLDIDRD